jgi:hypothetical protein
MKRDQASGNTDKLTYDNRMVGVAVAGQSDSREYEVREVVLATSSRVPDEIRILFAQDYIVRKLQNIFNICVSQEVLVPEELMVASALMQDLAEEIFAMGYDMSEAGKEAGEDILVFAALVRQDAQRIWMYTQAAMYASMGLVSVMEDSLEYDRGGKNSRLGVEEHAHIRQIRELVSIYKDPIEYYIDCFRTQGK